MAQRYAHVIGILGVPDAGKTAALVSLYLLLANAKLTGFKFADSDSLMAFDALSRGARDWNLGVMPGQMTGHTEGDDRGAGFLHLRLRRRAGIGLKHDLLLSDAPGEWTTQLIDKNVHARFSFLKRADAFWVVMDGRSLAGSTSRNLAVHRATLLLDRIRGFATAALVPPVFLVLTRRDCYDNTPVEPVERIAREAERLGVPFQMVEVASFSDRQDIPPGTGLNELVERTLEPRVHERPNEVPSGARQIFRYRSGR